MTKKRPGGIVHEYHYAFRGGPQFWKRGTEIGKGTPECSRAYRDVILNRPAFAGGLSS